MSGLRTRLLLIPLVVWALPSPAAEPTRVELSAVRSLIAEHRLVEAETAAREALTRAESEHGADSIPAARATDLVVEILERRGKWTDEETLALARRALAVKEKRLVPADTEIATSLRNLGRALQEGREPATAEPYFKRALSIQEAARGPDHPDVAESLDDLAVLQKDLGRYADARELHERALAIREKTFGPNDPTVADSLNGLGVTLRRMGETERARQAFERALAIREQALGPTASAVASTLLNLANLLRMTGDFSGAEPLYRRVLSIEEAQPDADPARIAMSTGSLANLLFETDDYRGARPLYERSLALLERARGPEHPDTAVAIRNLANLLTAIGDYAEAKALLERALAIRVKALGPDHPDVAVILNNLGEVLRRMGDLDAAAPLLERGLAIRERAFGPDHREVARSLRFVAALRRDRGELEDARAAMQRAIGIEVKNSGPESNMVAQDTMVLGGILALQGNLPAARRAFDKAEALFAKTGFEETHRAMALADGAKVSYLQRDFSSALEQALRAEALARESFKLTARALSEREAFVHEAIRSTGFDVVLSVAGLGPETRPARLDVSRIWTEVIRSRSMLLDEFASRHHVVRSVRSDVLEPRWAAVVRARENVSRLLVHGPTSGEGLTAKLSAAREELDTAERALAEASSRYRVELSRRAAGFQEVVAGLPDGSALVSYVRYRQIEPGDAPSRSAAYVAFVLGSRSTRPAAVVLGKAAAIDDLIRSWRAAVGSDPRSGDAARAEAAYREAGRKLREAIWDPLEGFLRGARQVFVVPDGAIHLVSFATLPTTRGKFLLETGPTLHYLSTERALVPGDETPPAGTGLLALGGPDFDSVGDVAAASEVGVPPGGGGAASFRGLPPACGDFRGMKFTRLGAARAEVERIESLWNGARADGEPPRSQAITLTGAQAREEAFKSLAPGRRSVHVATHGFFVDPSCTSATPGTTGWTAAALWGADDETNGALGENPLRLSGLALAGANRRDEAVASADREDGILTSEEIASLDLSDVEAVVLSACETGVGRVVNGEGVLGLRRAFEVAGARSLVMTLWPIEDDATRVWMSRFYESRIDGGSTSEAARQASLQVLSTLRSRQRPDHPFFWGAFVATGDWR